jgi:hypothetical protein
MHVMPHAHAGKKERAGVEEMGWWCDHGGGGSAVVL